ncbi:MAG: 16S rRNA (guanine(527)-N(7))-methyltransferase RsmG [Peptococcaceae bacterium]|jgi:16S rRNA (guanine527-N7)-methyltransferase|nr:16S rRNA (guanine(527)-N(7))-methyltransferase RsmG [Peptococcaceae bacterium]
MKQAIIDIFTKQGIHLPAEQLDKLALYGEMVLETNATMNLTAITEKDQIAEKHFLDAWQLLPVLESLFIKDLAGKKLIDIGSGAGFPAIPLAIFLPELSITLLESMEKRCNFLRQVVEALSLENVTIVCDRAETWGRGEGRSNYDMVTARAVARLSILCEYALPLLKTSGVFCAFKGAKAEEELAEAQNAIITLGGRVKGQYPYALLEPGERCITVIEKISPTAEKYPRRVGVPEKKPL